MELWQEILRKEIKRSKKNGTSEEEYIRGVIDSVSYRALKSIKEIIEDKSLSDAECFMKIEKIVCVLEEIGSDGGARHDFG